MATTRTKLRQSARGVIPSLFLLLMVLAPLSRHQSVFGADDDGLIATDQGPEKKFSDLVREIAIHSTEEGFEDTKHWNKSVKRFDGLSIRGLHISQKRKRVRHGFCRRYEAFLVRPEETFRLEIEQLPLDPTFETTQFVVTTQLRARSEATFAHYVYGVKGFNGSAVAHATIQLRLVLEIAPTFVLTADSLLPDLRLNARVNSVDLQLKDFDLQKLGPIKGDFAKILGDGSRESVEGLMQAQRSRIRKKLQKELDDIDGDPDIKQAKTDADSSSN